MNRKEQQAYYCGKAEGLIIGSRLNEEGKENLENILTLITKKEV